MASASTSTKRVGAKRRSGGEYLCDIMPTELMLEIGRDFDLSTKLKLRTAFPKRRQDIVNDLLTDPLKVLYLTPTEGSLRRFKEITKIAFFKQNITDVIFIPDAIIEDRDDDDDDDDIFPYFPDVSDLNHETANEVLNIHARLAHEHKHWSINSALWALGDDYINYEVSASLAAGLHRIPKLAVASVQLKIHKDGLNASNLSYAQGLLERRMAASSHALTDSEYGLNAVQNLRREGHDQEGIDTFLHAISVAQTNIESLTLGGTAGDQLDFDIQRFTNLSGTKFELLLPRLTELTISCEDSMDLGINADAWWWKCIAQAATGLQTLRVGIGEQEQAHRFNNEYMGCKVIDHFLRDGNYPNLRNFVASEVICQPAW